MMENPRRVEGEIAAVRYAENITKNCRYVDRLMMTMRFDKREAAKRSIAKRATEAIDSVLAEIKLLETSLKRAKGQLY
jgi:hypothetical protein